MPRTPLHRASFAATSLCRDIVMPLRCTQVRDLLVAGAPLCDVGSVECMQRQPWLCVSKHIVPSYQATMALLTDAFAMRAVACLERNATPNKAHVVVTVTLSQKVRPRLLHGGREWRMCVCGGMGDEPAATRGGVCEPGDIHWMLDCCACSS
jgi:hypothetical protein